MQCDGTGRLQAPASTSATAAGGTGTDNRTDRVARELEGRFAKLLLSSMRAASLGGDDALFPGAAAQYRDLYDDQLAQMLTSGRGLGLQEAIRRQLGESGGEAPATSPAVVDRSLPAAPATPAAEAYRAVRASTPEEFVARIWPHAQQAAAQLGVPAKTLIAQAALETGWGRHLPARAGGSSNNLFGIKAGAGWQGERTTAVTREYAPDGVREETARFRAYDSTAAGFADYVSLIRNNPRYAAALDHGGDGHHYVQALQRAGYATDPQYADKIRAIADGPTLRRVLAQLDGGDDGTARV